MDEDIRTSSEISTEGKKFYFDFFSEGTLSKRKYLLLVIYDISSNKTRNSFVRLLKTHGYRVQKSCFEIYASQSAYSKFVDDVQNFVMKNEIESIRIYKLTGVYDVVKFGSQIEYPIEDVIII